MAVGSRPLVPSRLAPGGVAHGSRRTPTSVVGSYIALTKPRIIELLLVTNTIPVDQHLSECPKIQPLSVANLLGEAIRRIHENSSVTSLFV